MKYTKTVVEQSRANLLETIKPGDTVYTILRHVSGSGMSRRISAVVMDAGEPMDISALVARVLGYRRHERDGALIVPGCGMNMGCEVVHTLGRVLFPSGFDVVGVGRNGDTSGHDSDGGYALKQR